MPDGLRLPIKVVIPATSDYQKPLGGGGGPKKVFGDVTSKLRLDLADQVAEVVSHFERAFQATPNLAAVARVTLKKDALAKSHRPSALFNSNTCPIIGGNAFGELLVSVQPKGLARLRQKIQEDDTKVGVAAISTVERIEPYRGDDADKITEAGREAIQRNGSLDMKLQLFRHRDSTIDGNILRAFRSKLEQIDLAPEQLQYGEGQRVFRVKNVPQMAVAQLAAFVGTQALSDFPMYRAVRTETIPLRVARVTDFPAPVAGETYPVVGIIDSGVNPDDPLLGPWTVAREDFVPPKYRDHNHGSFVAGLVVNGKILNHDDPRFPNVNAKFVDVVAIPGNGQSIREDDLVSIIEEVVPKHPSVKVWNLSLGTDSAPCRNDAFSDLAATLDRIQDQYGVRFVIASGNYRALPFRGWPPEDHGEDDRVCPPADSVRGITVGSIAHVERPNSRVKVEEPSPFSRRGPGACFLPKPEVVHYGGNCDRNGQYQQTGILSINGERNLAESVGTSFSTPLVSGLLANIYEALGKDASHVLAKALLVHSALTQSKAIRAEELRYRGFGVPADLLRVLTCDQHSATLIFEPGQVKPGLDFVKESFPIPDCLRTEEGKVRGEFLMTLAYDPPLDLAFGAEYCLRNVEVSLGTYDPADPRKPEHCGKIPCEPRDISKLYERNLVENGFKWSPIKVYRQEFPRGVAGEHWRVVVSAHDRQGVNRQEPTNVALVLTIRDPERKQPVYDQIVAKMTQSGWITQDLRMSDRVRARVRR